VNIATLGINYRVPTSTDLSGTIQTADAGSPTDGAPVHEPLPTKPSSWWRQFVFPVLGRLIHKADAVQALKLVLAELRIAADVPR
jgi:hypothetical protein